MAERPGQAAQGCGRPKLTLLAAVQDPGEPADEDRLGLVFGCCHLDLPEQAQVALTLRAAGGLSTPEIAATFLSILAIGAKFRRPVLADTPADEHRCRPGRPERRVGERQ